MTAVNVIQADRDAAAALMEAICEGSGEPTSFDAYRRGEEDAHFVVQAVARHRTDTSAPLLAALEAVCAILDAHREPAGDPQWLAFEDPCELVNDLEKNGVHERITAAIAQARQS